MTTHLQFNPAAPAPAQKEQCRLLGQQPQSTALIDQLGRESEQQDVTGVTRITPHDARFGRVDLTTPTADLPTPSLTLTFPPEYQPTVKALSAGLGPYQELEPEGTRTNELLFRWTENGMPCRVIATTLQPTAIVKPDHRISRMYLAANE